MGDGAYIEQDGAPLPMLAPVAILGGREYSGFVAWVIWLAIHIISLIGFRNRLLVLTNWAWDYLFFEWGVRLIDPNP